MEREAPKIEQPQMYDLEKLAQASKEVSEGREEVSMEDVLADRSEEEQYREADAQKASEVRAHLDAELPNETKEIKDAPQMINLDEMKKLSDEMKQVNSDEKSKGIWSKIKRLFG